MKTKSLLFMAMAFIATKPTEAQEFLVTVDPMTAIHTTVAPIPSTKSVQIAPSFATIDKVQNRYFFKGISFNGDEKLYIINASTGATNREVVIPTSNASFGHVGNLQFDDSTGNIYATGLHIATNTLYLLQLDTMTAAVSTIVAIPGIGTALVNQSAYDQNSHRYMFSGVAQASAGGDHRYVAVDVLTGSVVANTTLNQKYTFCSLRWNNATGKLYAFIYDMMQMPAMPHLLHELDPMTGSKIAPVAVTPSLGTIPNLPWSPATAPNLTSIDEINNRYTVAIDQGFDPNGVKSFSLCTISLSTGSVLSRVHFPQGLNMAGENVIELHYNNNNGNLYGLHWKYTTGPVGIGQAGITTDRGFFPNPTDGITTLDLDRDYKDASVRVFDCSGRLIGTRSFVNGEPVSVDLTSRDPGVYFAETRTDGVIRVSKIVKFD